MKTPKAPPKTNKEKPDRSKHFIWEKGDIVIVPAPSTKAKKPVKKSD